MMHHKEILAELIQNIAGLCGSDPSEIDSTASFVEIGFDSLMLAKLTQFIQDTFAVAVEPRELFEGAASIEALAELIAQRRPVSTAPQPAAMARSSTPHAAAPAPAGPAAAPPPPPVFAIAGTPAVFEEGSPLQKLFAQQLQLMSQQLQILQRQEA